MTEASAFKQNAKKGDWRNVGGPAQAAHHHTITIIGTKRHTPRHLCLGARGLSLLCADGESDGCTLYHWAGARCCILEGLAWGSR